ncbi:hypothetical protein D3C78_1717240 [compost metagenome]
MRPTVLNTLDRSGKGAQLAGFEQHAQRQLDIASLSGAGNDLGRQQRMATQGEEIILQTDLLQPQHLAPDSGDLLLQCSVRFDVFTAGP